MRRNLQRNEIALSRIRFCHPVQPRGQARGYRPGRRGCCPLLSLDLQDQGNGAFSCLGGNNGLRGYPADYNKGNRRLLFSMEKRYFTDIHLFNLVRVAAAGLDKQLLLNDVLPVFNKDDPRENNRGSVPEDRLFHHSVAAG